MIFFGANTFSKTVIVTVLVMDPLKNIEKTIAACVLLLIICFFMTPLMFYYLHKYWKYRHDPIILKRHYTVVALNIFFVWANMIGDKGLYMISIIITDSNLEKTHENTIYLLSDYAYYIFGPCIFLAFAVRTWLLFYDLKFMKLTKYDQKWKHFINPQKYTDNTLNNNWFIKHKQTFGNSHFLLLKVFTPTILITCIILSIMYYFFRDLSIHYFIFLLFIVSMTILVGIIYCKLPQHQIEFFKMKQEISIQLKIGVSFIVFFVIYIILRIFVFDSYTFWLIMPYQYICVVHYWFVAYFSTEWVLKTTELLYSEERKLEELVDSSISDVAGIPLSRILRNKLSFNIFMQHLSSEFSTESLLCIAECWQFKLMMKQKYPELKQSELIKVLDEQFHSFRLSKDIPQSTIVYDDALSINTKVIKLLLKYIKENAMFEINVSGHVREGLMGQMTKIEANSLSMQQYYDFFDETILELLHLLRDARQRFKHTHEHSKLLTLNLE